MSKELFTNINPENQNDSRLVGVGSMDEVRDILKKYNDEHILDRELCLFVLTQQFSNEEGRDFLRRYGELIDRGLAPYQIRNINKKSVHQLADDGLREISLVCGLLKNKETEQMYLVADDSRGAKRWQIIQDAVESIE